MIGYFRNVRELQEWAAVYANLVGKEQNSVSQGFARAMQEIAEFPHDDETAVQAFAAGLAVRAEQEFVSHGEDAEHLGYSMGMRDIVGSVIHPDVEVPAHQVAFMNARVSV